MIGNEGNPTAKTLDVGQNASRGARIPGTFDTYPSGKTKGLEDPMGAYRLLNPTEDAHVEDIAVDHHTGAEMVPVRGYGYKPSGASISASHELREPGREFRNPVERVMHWTKRRMSGERRGVGRYSRKGSIDPKA